MLKAFVRRLRKLISKDNECGCVQVTAIFSCSRCVPLLCNKFFKSNLFVKKSERAFFLLCYVTKESFIEKKFRSKGCHKFPIFLIINLSLSLFCSRNFNHFNVPHNNNSPPLGNASQFLPSCRLCFRLPAKTRE